MSFGYGLSLPKLKQNLVTTVAVLEGEACRRWLSSLLREINAILIGLNHSWQESNNYLKSGLLQRNFLYSCLFELLLWVTETKILTRNQAGIPSEPPVLWAEWTFFLCKLSNLRKWTKIRMLWHCPRRGWKVHAFVGKPDVTTHQFYHLHSSRQQLGSYTPQHWQEMVKKKNSFFSKTKPDIPDFRYGKAHYRIEIGFLFVYF